MKYAAKRKKKNVGTHRSINGGGARTRSIGNLLHPNRTDNRHPYRREASK